MCIRRTELHFIISFAADDFWLQSLIKVNNQKLARTRDVNVLEFASLNWTILRKLIHRALFFFFVRAFGRWHYYFVLIWASSFALSQARMERRVHRIFSAPTSSSSFTKKEAHFLWLLWTRLVATFCVVCFARALGPTSAHMRSFSIPFWSRWWNGWFFFSGVFLAFV